MVEKRVKKASKAPEPENLLPPEQFPKEVKWAQKPIERCKTALMRELQGIDATDKHAEKAKAMIVKALAALG